MLVKQNLTVTSVVLLLQLSI